MNYKELFREKNEAVAERHELTIYRLRELAGEGSSLLTEELNRYFQKTAGFLLKCQEVWQKVESGEFETYTAEMLKEENLDYYSDILPENYETSYANPAYAVKELGEEYGRILSFLYTELRSERVFAFEQNLEKITVLNELFLEIFGMFETEKVSYHQIREVVYWFLYDYADMWAGERVRELLDPELSFATDIVMTADLSDCRYLYAYGEYISDNEIKTAEFLNSLSEEEIREIAFTFTDGYREGFALKNVDLSKKQTVNIRYNIGF